MENGDKSSLRKAVIEQMFRVRKLRARLIGVYKNDLSKVFVQLTLEFLTKQFQVPIGRKIVFETHLSFGELELSVKTAGMTVVQDTTKKPSTKFLLPASLLSSKDGEMVRAYIRNTECSKDDCQGKDKAIDKASTKKCTVSSIYTLASDVGKKKKNSPSKPVRNVAILEQKDTVTVVAVDNAEDQQNIKFDQKNNLILTDSTAGR
ncbi:hypothetical protein FRX31_032341, partial [Thalictrum thalictroides]